MNAAPRTFYFRIALALAIAPAILFALDVTNVWRPPRFPDVPSPLDSTFAAASLVVIVGLYVVVFTKIWGQTEGGMFREWRIAADDPRYPPLAPPGKDAWLQGRGALGAPSSADLKAAAVRSIWLDDDRHWPDVAATVRIEHDDGVPTDLLRDAAQRGLHAARNTVENRGEVRIRAEAHDEPGPETLSTAHVHVTAAGATSAWAHTAADAYATTFVARLAQKGYTARRVS